MVYSKKNNAETAAMTNTKTDTFTKKDFNNYSPLSFQDRRVSNRRVSDRRRGKGNKLKKITVIIPCYNEEKGISKVIDDIPVKKLAYLGYRTETMVINNNSSDRTVKIALDKGARVVSEKSKARGMP